MEKLVMVTVCVKEFNLIKSLDHLIKQVGSGRAFYRSLCFFVVVSNHCLLLGHEFISIAGETTRNMMMKVFAYGVGAAKVTYSWARAESDCCTGQGICTGTFQQAVLKREVVVVGAIPKGKNEIYIELVSTGDVDIQLYDTDNTNTYSEGLAIVGWCMCANSGLLSKGGSETVIYQDRTYNYSGFNGDGTNKGNEFIAISGVSNRNLMMKVFGYVSGYATVNYRWREVTLFY